MIFFALGVYFSSQAQTNNNQPTGLLPKGTLLPLTTTSNDVKNTIKVAEKKSATTIYTGSSLTPLTDAPLTSNSTNNQSAINTNANAYSLTPLTSNTTAKAIEVKENLQPLLPLTATPNKSLQQEQQSYQQLQQLAPLNSGVIQGIKTNSTIQGLTPNGNYGSGSKPNDGLNYYNAKQQSNSNTMPALAPIQSSNNNLGERFAMPALASIDDRDIPQQQKAQTGMPELAPIESAEDNSNSKTPIMPALQPINGENGGAAIVPNKDGSYLIKSITLPYGTEIKGTRKQAVLVRPNVVVQPQEKPYKPGAGGGMGLILSDDEPQQQTTEYQGVTYQSQQPKYVTKKVTVYQQQPQQVVYQQQPQQQVVYQQPQQQVAYQQPKTTYTAKPCLHNHTVPCPCCVAKPAVAKKWKPKPKKRYAYRQPVTYIYEEIIEEPQPQIVYQQPQVKVQERVIYVPMQQQKQTVVQQPITQKPVEQPQQKVVYTDYTKIYYKEPEKPQNNCACPVNTNTNNYNNNNNQNNSNNNYYNQNNNQSSGTMGVNNSANQPQKYYAPSNYQGLNAGPASGDYPINNNTTDDPFRYTFYVNEKGKYSVLVYNQRASLIVRQDGIVESWNPTSESNSQQNNGTKLNYFGKPETLGGIPIAYNYNRKIHKIGNIKFDYDFEGFFKTVNGSNVFYNNRSSLERVDQTKVIYDMNGYVTGVDPNNDLIKLSN